MHTVQRWHRLCNDEPSITFGSSYLVALAHEAQQVQEKVDDVHVEVQCSEGIVVDGELHLVISAYDHLGVVDDVETEEQYAHEGVQYLNPRRKSVEKAHQRDYEGETNHTQECAKQVGTQASEIRLREASVSRKQEEGHRGRCNCHQHRRGSVERSDKADDDGHTDCDNKEKTVIQWELS